MPSLPSSEARTTAMRSAVSAMTLSSIGRLATARISAFAAACACGPATSSAPSISLTLASSSSGGTMSCTSPIRNASAASKRSAVRK